jgi:hypothetical protein
LRISPKRRVVTLRTSLIETTEIGASMLPKKRIPTHPGEILLHEFLIPLGVAQVALAAHIGVSVPAAALDPEVAEGWMTPSAS